MQGGKKNKCGGGGGVCIDLFPGGEINCYLLTTTWSCL